MLGSIVFGWYCIIQKKGKPFKKFIIAFLEMVRKVLKVLIAEPHGFCVGVKRAVDILSKAVDEFGNEFGMIYCLHELVHNPFVVDDFRRKGVVFVESIEEVPDKSVVVFSAHGVSPKVRKRAEEKNLKVVDATCPLVELVHKKVRDYHTRGFSIIYVGKKGHVEVEGVLGESPLFVVSSVEDVDGLQVGDGFGSKGVVCLTQTTLSVDDTAEIIQKLKQRFPDIVLDGGICNATQERQDAVKKLAKKCDLIHTTTFNGAPPAFVASKLRKKPIILTVHEVWLNNWHNFTELNLLSCKIHEFLERLIYSLSYSRYVAVSKATQQQLIKNGI